MYFPGRKDTSPAAFSTGSANLGYAAIKCGYRLP